MLLLNRQCARIIAKSPETTAIDLNAAVKVLFGYADARYDEVSIELGKMGIFMKVEGMGNIRNTGPNIREQFKKISVLHNILPENIPKPFVLLNLSGINAYLIEKIPGMTLSDYISLRNGAMQLESVQRLSSRIRSAVEGIHGAGMYHGDLSMNNVIVRTDNEGIVLIDPKVGGLFPNRRRTAREIGRLNAIERILLGRSPDPKNNSQEPASLAHCLRAS